MVRQRLRCQPLAGTFGKPLRHCSLANWPRAPDIISEPSRFGLCRVRVGGAGADADEPVTLFGDADV